LHRPPAAGPAFAAHRMPAILHRLPAGTWRCFAANRVLICGCFYVGCWTPAAGTWRAFVAAHRLLVAGTVIGCRTPAAGRFAAHRPPARGTLLGCRLPAAGTLIVRQHVAGVLLRVGCRTPAFSVVILGDNSGKTAAKQRQISAILPDNGCYAEVVSQAGTGHGAVFCC
jgi:hypothetical protein